MKLRVLALALAILAFFIFVCSPFEQAAEALVGIDDALVVVLIAILAGAGITFATTGAFDDVQSYVESLMQEYATSQSTTVSEQLRGARTGSNTLGQLIVNNRFLVYADTFILWLKSKLGLTNYGQTEVVQSGFSLGGLSIYPLPITVEGTEKANGRLWVHVASSNSPVYVLVSSDGPNNILFSSESFVVTTVYSVNGQTTPPQYFVSSPDSGYWNNASLNNPLYNWADIGNNELPMVKRSNVNYSWSIGGVPAKYSNSAIIAALTGSTDFEQNEGMSVVTGVINPPSDDTDYVPGDGGVIDVDADWGTPFDIIVGQVIPDAVIDGTIGDTVITYDGEDAVQDQVTDVGGTTISSNPGDYQVSGIASVFPFCIPFDVYNFLAVLDAEPEAPHFQWRFYVPGIYDGTIDIDLSPFNGVAQVLRTAELLLFIVGLAVVTRNRFIRS